MTPTYRRAIRTGLPVAVAIAAGCATPRHSAAQGVQPAPPPTADTARPRHTTADARFMQGMMVHHAQAVTMAGLVPARSGSPDVRLLAERIDVSQKDEIAMLRRWLERRGEAIPLLDADHEHHDTAGGSVRMPGMLTPDEMARLEHATGVEFDRLFLQGMITHHEGALTMVAALFATSGAAQEPQIFDFASDVDASQRVEIRRMRAMLGALPTDPPDR